MNIIFFILIFQILYNVIKSDMIQKCEVMNYCGQIPCSSNGYCDFNFTGYEINSLYDLLINNISCKCYSGYSSYDIEYLDLRERTVYCCYEKKSHLTAFYLEFFLGLGIGHFYVGNMRIGLIKFFYEIALYIFCILMSYFTCKKERTIVIDLNDVNKKEENGEQNKIGDENYIKENDEDENVIDENKNEKSELNESYDEEEEKINELLSDNLIKCPKTKFFILGSFSLIVILRIIDISLLGFGFYTDKNGEQLDMWS